MKKPKDEFDIDIQACSATDCTGLIPALPESEAQLEFYDELYPFLPRASACAGRPDPKPPASKRPDSKNPG